MGLVSVIGIILAGVGLDIYLGNYLREERSPDQEHVLRYDSATDSFNLTWSLPGKSDCTPRWIRLYDRHGKKLNEMYTTDCALENPVIWLEGEVVLPDGKTVWPRARHPICL